MSPKTRAFVWLEFSIYIYLELVVVIDFAVEKSYKSTTEGGREGGGKWKTFLCSDIKRRIMERREQRGRKGPSHLEGTALSLPTLHPNSLSISRSHQASWCRLLLITMLEGDGILGKLT